MLSPCRWIHRAGARAVAERYASIFGRGDGPSTSGFFIELSHHLLPDDDWLVAESAALAAELGLPVVVTNDVHYATADDRELHDVLTAIRHGRTLDTLADLRRPDGESYLKSGAELAALADGFDRGRPRRGLARGDRDVGRDRGARARSTSASSATASRASRCPRGDAVLVPVGAVLGGCPSAVPPADVGGRQAAGPRARRHRAGRPRRVLPHLLGPHALREGAGDPGPGPGQRDQLDRVVHPRDQPGRADRPQPPVRAVHQRGPDDLPGRRHRLQLGAARGGHPVRLPALRAGAHGHGLQPRHVPGALGGARGGLRAGVPAAARRSGRQGARDVRLGHGPARPRGGRRVRRVLPTDGRGTAGRGPGGGAGRGTRPRRRDGPAAAAGPARREGAALAPAADSRRTRTHHDRSPGSATPDGGHEAEAEPFREDPLAPVTDDPTGRPVRRRGRTGRHPGERGLAAGRSRHGLPGPGAGAPCRWTRTTACRSPRRARPTDSGAPACGTHRRTRAPTSSSVARGRARRRRRRPAAVPRSGCRTGSAGSSSAPASTASRAISRSTRAGCS